MALVSWSPTFSVGVTEFDQQHRRWFDLINKLHDAMVVGRGREVVGSVLEEVAAYTRTHFAAEEAILKATAYPDFAKHKALHDGFIAEMERMTATQRGAGSAITIDALTALRTWLTNHIQAADRLYTAHLNAKGVR